MSVRLLLAGALLLAILSVDLTAASAQMVNPSYLRKQQYRQQQQQQQQQRKQAMTGQPTTLEGTLVGAMRGTLQIIDDKRQTWRVGILPATKVHVTGSANADALRNGMVVEFQAEVDQQGAIVDKVGELSIVSLSDDKRPGLYPSGGGATDPRVATAKKPAVAKPARTAKHGVPTPGSYRIVGQLNFNRNKMTVHADRYHLPLELSDSPNIAIDSSDYTLASRGDKISVQGMLVPNRIGQMYATEVKIELGGALGNHKKNPANANNPAAHKPAQSTPGEQP